MPDEQRLVLLRRGLERAGAHGGHQSPPRRLEEGAALRRLGHRHRELLEQPVVRRREDKPRQQAVDLGALQFLALVGRRTAGRRLP